MNWRFRWAGAFVVLAAVAICLQAALVRTAEEPMTLEACLREALTKNPDIGATVARTEAASSAADVARSARLPRLDLTSGYSYSDRPQRLVPPSYQGEVVNFNNDIATAAFEIRVPLFTGGRLASRIKAAELAAAGSRFSLSGTRQDIILNVTAAYLAAVEQKAVLAAIQASLEALLSQLEIAGALEEVGRTAPLARLKVEVRVASVTQRMSKARRDEELIRVHLGVLLGRDPRTPPPSVGDLPLLPQQDIVELDSFVGEAVSSRPELAALRQETAMRRAELALAKAERWPSLDVFGSWTIRSVVPFTGGFPPGHHEFLTGGLSLKFPVWTGGEIKSRVGQAQSFLSEAQERERAGNLKVAEEIRRETAALAEARDREKVALKGMEQARQAFSIERANYELGRGTINDLLDAQAAQLEAELALAQARHDIAFSSVALAHAIGRDLEKLLVEKKDDQR
jgi:outer membrane protein TolC